MYSSSDCHPENTERMQTRVRTNREPDQGPEEVSTMTFVMQDSVAIERSLATNLDGPLFAD